jgi:hypothetical protein
LYAAINDDLRNACKGYRIILFYTERVYIFFKPYFVRLYKYIKYIFSPVTQL